MKQFCPANWSETHDDSFAFRRRQDGNLRRELCREIANLKLKAGCSDFPTNVRALAAEVGIREIRQVPLVGRGRLLRVPGGCDVEINEKVRGPDERFVIAHEISHVLLDRVLARSSGNRLGHARLEALCDFGAREILLPLNTVRYELKRVSVASLLSFIAMADTADCSLSLVAQIVSELPGRWQDLLFVLCRTRTGAPDVVRVIPQTQKRVELSCNDTDLVSTALREDRLVRGGQRIWFDDVEFEISGEALPVGDGEVAVLAQERPQRPRNRTVIQ